MTNDAGAWAASNRTGELSSPTSSNWWFLGPGLGFLLVGIGLFAEGLHLETVGTSPSIERLTLWILLIDFGIIVAAVGACLVALGVGVIRTPGSSPVSPTPPVSLGPRASPGRGQSTPTGRPAGTPDTRKTDRKKIATRPEPSETPPRVPAVVAPSPGSVARSPLMADRGPEDVPPPAAIRPPLPQLEPAASISDPPVIARGTPEALPEPQPVSLGSFESPQVEPAAQLPTGACTRCGTILEPRNAWRKCAECGGTLCANCLIESLRAYGRPVCDRCAARRRSGPRSNAV